MNPAERCVSEVERAVSSLRDLVRPCETRDVVGQCFAFHLRRGQPDAPPDFSLLSPARQCSFLLGQLLASPEPEAPREFKEEEWKTAQALLNQAFSAYQILFNPSEEMSEAPSPEWWRARDVALPTFLHFFNTSLLASTDQVAERVRRYLTPWDPELRSALGISASDALAIATLIGDSLQRALDSTTLALRKARATQIEILDRAKAAAWSVDQIREAARGTDAGPVFEDFTRKITTLGIISLQTLREKFPDTAEIFWRLFTVARGSGPQIDFPTERTIFDDRPLVQVTANEAFVPLLTAVFTAILDRGERALLIGSNRDSYLRRRDRIFEQEVCAQVSRLLGDEVSIYANVSEAPDGRFEHDLVVLGEDLCLLLEAKASPLIEPFRDPDKAFTRLRHAFSAESGIQGAYDQAMRIWRRLQAGEDVPLYDRNGRVSVVIPATSASSTFCVCATRDSFGPLATDLALLLEKAPQEPYPWVINVLDMTTLADAWQYLKWGSGKLHDYLRTRVILHGRAFSWDELDYAGYFIRHGGLESADRGPTDLLFLDPTYSDVFDRIEGHVKHGLAAPDLTPKQPVTTDVRRSLEAGRPIVVGASDASPDRVGRNSPCPCGSGKKYKRCCGAAA